MKEKNLGERIVENEKDGIARLSDSPILRAGMQLIPVVGGFVESFIVSKGNAIRKERVLDYLRAVEATGLNSNVDFEKIFGSDVEEMFDLLRLQLSIIDKTRSSDKRKQFANILVNRTKLNRPFLEAEMASSMLEKLSDAHVLVLREICAAPMVPSPWEMKRVSVVEKRVAGPGDVVFNTLETIFPDLNIELLKLIVIELNSMGLIRDEGAGRLGFEGPLVHISPMPLASWLLDWIQTPAK